MTLLVLFMMGKSFLTDVDTKTIILGIIELALELFLVLIISLLHV